MGLGDWIDDRGEDLGNAWRDYTGVTGAEADIAATQQAATEAERIREEALRHQITQTGEGVGQMYDSAQQGLDALGLQELQAQNYLGAGRDDSLAALGSSALGAMNASRAGYDTAAGGIQGMYQGFEADPGYQFRKQQGEGAINAAASAHGGRLSGRTLQALGEFNSGLASQEFGNFAQRAQTQQGALADLAMQEGGRQAGLNTGWGHDVTGVLQGTAGMQAGSATGYGARSADIFTGTGANALNAYAGQGNAELASSGGAMNSAWQGAQGAGDAARARGSGYGQAIDLGAGAIEYFTGGSGSSGYDNK